MLQRRKGARTIVHVAHVVVILYSADNVFFVWRVLRGTWGHEVLESKVWRIDGRHWRTGEENSAACDTPTPPPSHGPQTKI